MRKRLIFFFIGIVLLYSCKKEEIVPPEMPPYLEAKREQWGLVINYTASWCGPCGSWGSPTVHQLANMSPRVVAVTNHAYGDPMHNQWIYLLMADDRQVGSGIPSFWIGDQKTYSSTAMQLLLERTPIAGIDMKAKQHGDSIKFAYQVKFFESAQGEFYLSFWLLESGIPGGAGTGEYQQAGTSDQNYKHDFVIRAVKDLVYGRKIVTNPTQGYTLEEISSIYVNSAWKNRLTLVCCLWRFDPQGDPTNYNPRYKFVNAYQVPL